MQFKENLLKSYEDNIHNVKYIRDMKNHLFVLNTTIAYESIDGESIISGDIVNTIHCLYNFLNDLEKTTDGVSPLT